jgi:hypothetical protein
MYIYIYIYNIFIFRYYSDIKKYEIISFVEKWMELEIIMLNKISPAQKAKYHMLSLFVELRPKVMMISVIMVMMMAHEQKRDSLRGN